MRTGPSIPTGLAIFAVLTCAAVFPVGPAALCADNPPPPAPPPPPLRERIAERVTDYERRQGAIVGVSAVDLLNGKTLVDLRQDNLFIPASNQKLLTGAFAIARLGADFRFATSVHLCGENLVVVGDYDPLHGDPLLAQKAKKSIYADLDQWSAVVRKAIGEKITGDLILSCGADPRSYRHEDWPMAQRYRWYAAPVAPLNFHNNCFDATFAVRDGKVAADVTPAARLIRVVNHLQLGGKHIWSLQPTDGDATIILRGTIQKATTDPLSVAANDPPMLLGRVFADRLERADVLLTGEVRAATVSDETISAGRKLCETLTPLSAVMHRANKRSLNLAAECMFLRAGDGTWAGGAKAMTITLRQLAELKPDGLVVRDGGGLSRKNRVTPETMTKVLAAMAGHKDAKVFLSSLPISGTDGTMRSRLNHPPYRGRVLAKTGYLAGVSCLSGYVLDADGKAAIAFAILVNSIPADKASDAKQLQDDVCQMLVDSLGSTQSP